MNIAHYGKYPRHPLSIESLDFIQEQIKLIYNISDLYGTNYILRKPTHEKEGVLIKDGEVLPIRKGDPTAAYIVLETTPNDVTADGQDFQGLETVRTAYYTSDDMGTSNCCKASDFEVITSISKIKEVLDTTKTDLQSVKSALSAGPVNPVNDVCKHLLPKGSIIMWSGTTDENDPTFPKGFVICKKRDQQTVNGVSVPDLSGRFIVGRDQSDTSYSTIGNNANYKRNTITLDSNHLPRHRHGFNNYYWIEANNDTYNVWGKELLSGSGSCSEKVQTRDNRALFYKPSDTDYTGSNSITPIDIRPSYYVLAYIIKVI